MSMKSPLLPSDHDTDCNTNAGAADALSLQAAESERATAAGGASSKTSTELALEQFPRDETMHKLLFPPDEAWWTGVVPFLSVLVPYLYSTISSAVTPVQGAMVNCSDSSGVFSFSVVQYYNLSTCVEANHQVATVPISFLQNATGGMLVVLQVFVGLLLLQLMVAFYMDERRAKRFMPFGIYIGDVKRSMVVRIIYVGFVLITMAIELGFVQILSAQGQELIPFTTNFCAPKNDGSGCDPFTSLYPKFSDKLTTYTAANLFAAAVPLLLQFSAFFAFILRRFDDLYDKVTLKSIVRPKLLPRQELLTSISHITYKASMMDVIEVIQDFTNRKKEGCDKQMYECKKRWNPSCCMQLQVFNLSWLIVEYKMTHEDMAEVCMWLKERGKLRPLARMAPGSPHDDESQTIGVDEEKDNNTTAYNYNAVP